MNGQIQHKILINVAASVFWKMMLPIKGAVTKKTKVHKKPNSRLRKIVFLIALQIKGLSSVASAEEMDGSNMTEIEPVSAFGAIIIANDSPVRVAYTLKA